MKLILMGLGFLLTAGITFAAPPVEFDYDGCFQLYSESATFPAFCLSGTTEEGIGGAGARLILFNPSSGDVIACILSSGLNVTENAFEFQVKGSAENGIILQGGIMSGRAKLGKTELSYSLLNRLDTEKLIKSWLSSTVECSSE